MPDQPVSVVYHLDILGHIPPGRLVYVDDRDGGVADAYFHRLHARQELVWQLNWIGRHQVGMGLWRQRWTHDGRMQQPSEGRNLNVSRWKIVSPAKLPKGCHVFPTEQDGSCLWLIRRGSCTTDLLREMNGMLERIAGDGLWEQVWEEGPEHQYGILLPAMGPAALPLST